MPAIESVPKQAGRASDPRQPGETREVFFTRIVHEHARFLYRVAYGLLRHAEDAEDAVQEALLKLYRGDAWRDMQDERAFLARTVWRVALDRKAARVVATEDDAEYRLSDARATPEQAAAGADERALLQQWIGELPEDLRTPLLLSAVDEMNSREIGVVMRLPEGTVRTRLMRARAELRAKWQGSKGQAGDKAGQQQGAAVS